MSRPAPDPLLTAIADYLVSPLDASEEAAETARLCLLDALGCAFAALAHPECTKLLGPVVPGTRAPWGTRVPGTTGPRSFVHSGWARAAKAQPRASSRQRRAVSAASA